MKMLFAATSIFSFFSNPTPSFQVYIVGHAPPGSDTRHGYNAYSSDSNAKYLRTVRKYARVIAGQFFGHLHADTFRVIYDNGELILGSLDKGGWFAIIWQSP